MRLNGKFDAILLAAQRSGIVNPLAEKYGVSHKCIIPVAGVSLIERMLQILSTHPECRAIHISIEDEGAAKISDVITKFARDDLEIRTVPSASNLAESVMDACHTASPPYLITTADNVLLKHESINQIMAALDTSADSAVGLASRDAVRRVHPSAQRRFYHFRDGGYANCNLYAISSKDSLHGAEIFRSGGQFRKNPRRLLSAIGLVNIIMMATRISSMEGAFARLSRRMGLQIKPVKLTDGTQAVDVDNERTYRVVEAIIENRIDKLEL